MPLADLDLDIPAAIDRRRSPAEQAAGIDPAELRGLTVELYDRLDELVAGLDDAAVGFVPADSAADGAPGWTLGHVVAHLTAGLEENAAQGCTLARGADITGRPRYETPWDAIATAEQVRQRLAESRRMVLAFLEAWPDAPHRENVHAHPFFGPTDPVAYHLLGIVHGRGHLTQIEEIRRQVRAGA